MTNLAPVMALLGPTAVGKTAASLRVAERLGGEIVSVDSRLLYRGMDVGTAKPSLAEQARVPHHLVDVADPLKPWSLADFREAALAVIGEIHVRGRLPLLVGGTGQYLTAILEGWQPPPRPADDRIRRALEREAETHGAAELHRRLASVDVESAHAIDPRNVRRVIRALEVHALTGVAASSLKTRKPPAFRPFRVGLWLPRDELYARIDARIDTMLAEGWLDEVRALLQAGVDPSNAAMSAIGYRPLAMHVMGALDLGEAVRQVRRDTRRFVRRQANWFKPGDERIHWFESRPGVEGAIIDALSDWLTSPDAT